MFTLNFISIHSLSIYKLGMIRFVHKVHFDVDFQITLDFTLFSRDNLIKTSTQCVRPGYKLFLFIYLFLFCFHNV